MKEEIKKCKCGKNVEGNYSNVACSNFPFCIDPPKQDMSLDKVLEEFDEKFSRIVDMSRGEFAITNVAGNKFEAHVEDGKVTEVGGLKSIKDFIRKTYLLGKQEGLQEAVAKLPKKCQIHGTQYTEESDLIGKGYNACLSDLQKIFNYLK